MKETLIIMVSTAVIADRLVGQRTLASCLNISPETDFRSFILWTYELPTLHKNGVTIITKSTRKLTYSII